MSKSFRELRIKRLKRRNSFKNCVLFLCLLVMVYQCFLVRHILEF